jgi:CubicO group peptidase (beta-lactamase class C family)
MSLPPVTVTFRKRAPVGRRRSSVAHVPRVDGQGCRRPRGELRWRRGAEGLALLLLLSFVLQLPVLAAAGERYSRPARVDRDDIAAFVESEMARAGIPGLSLAIVVGDEVVHLEGFGVADGAGRPVTPQTPFIIGSIGKTFTALAIQQLAHDGLLDRRAPVQRYLPGFALANPEAAAQITVQQLLNHTSGLPRWAGERAHQLDPRYTTAELVDKARDVAIDRPVGTSYAYSNLNYLLLGLVVEVVSGQSYTDYISAHIWRPLGMFRTVHSPEAADGLATGYRTLFGVRRPAHVAFPPGMVPSGYAISTAEDLSHYLVAYLDAGRYAGATVMDTPGSYDVYWNRLPASGTDIESSQSGGTLNYNADIHILPAQGVAVAVLTNTRHLWDDVLPVTTAASIAGHIARQVAGLPVPPPPSLGLWPSYALLDGLALALLALALWRLRRAIRSGASRFPWPAATCDVASAALLLAGVPALSSQRWNYLLRVQPDLAGVALFAGLVLGLAAFIQLAALVQSRKADPAAAAATVAAT